MIDWLTFQVDFRHAPIPAGFVMSVGPNGEYEWASVKRVAVRGSHDSNFTVRSLGSADDGVARTLSFSGNPSKFLQGHNLFGSDDLIGLAVAVVRQIDAAIQIGIDEATYAKLQRGNFMLSMVDINYSFELRDQADVMAWIHAAEFKSRNRAGRSTVHPGTIYWGKNSRQWAMKAYSKFLEITKGPKAQRIKEGLRYVVGPHGPMPGTDVSPMLLEWAYNKLRIELRLLSRELRRLKLSWASDFVQKNTVDIFNHYLGEIRMAPQMPIRPEKLAELPRKVQSTYTLWRAGHHMAEMLPKSTFYIHRKILLEHGVDLTMACDVENKSSNVVPFVRLLEAKPVHAPVWAETYPGMLFCA